MNEEPRWVLSCMGYHYRPICAACGVKIRSGMIGALHAKRLRWIREHWRVQLQHGGSFSCVPRGA